MDKKRIFRALVCLVLICALLVGVSPIKAKASLAVAALTAPQVAGLITCIVGTVVGNIILVESLAELAAVGDVIYTPGRTDDDQILFDDLTSYTSNLNNYWNGDGDDPDPGLGLNEEFILGAAASVLYDSIVNGRLETEVEEEVEVDVPSGFASYNGHVLPDISSKSSNYDYAVITYNPNDSGWNRYTLWVSDSPFYFKCPQPESIDQSLYIYCADYHLYYRFYPDGSYGDIWTHANAGSAAGWQISPNELVWANYNVYGESSYEGSADTLLLSASDPITSDHTTTEKKTITIDPIYVGDLPTQIENGDLDEEESKEKILAPLPDYIDITKVIKSPETAVEDLTQWQQEVVDNQKTLEEALEDITGEIKDIQDDLEPDPEPETDYTSLLDLILDAIRSLARKIVDPILEGIKSLFVPSPGYIDGKIADLTNKYDFAKQIAESGIEFKDWFMNLGQTPPIIHIDLGAARGFHHMGGKVVFVDMTWYEEYKPTVDGIISSFLWLWFIWRILLSLPGIIQGTSGFWNKVDSDAGANYAPDPKVRWDPHPRGYLESGDRSLRK